MQAKSFSLGAQEYLLEAVAVRCGDDLTVVIGGGEKQHIGAVAVGVPRPSLKDKNIVSYRLVAPDRKGRIFLDRLTFPEKKMNLRTTPDQQLPANNGLSNRDLWHWCLVW